MKVFFKNSFRHFKDANRKRDEVVVYPAGEQDIPDGKAKALIKRGVCTKVGP